MLGPLLTRLWATESELPVVLVRPRIPLHTIRSDNDIQCYATRRKVSGGTRGEAGRDRRDAFLDLARTCVKPGMPLWGDRGDRLTVAGSIVIGAPDQ